MCQSSHSYASIVAGLMLVTSLPLFAKDKSLDVSADNEKRITRILGQTCGTGSQDELEGLKRSVDLATAKRYMTWVLANGAPERERRAARKAAARRFEMRKAVLAKPNERLFDAATAARMRAIDRESYLEAAEVGIDRIYRGNAIHWLGEVAGQDMIPAIRAAAVKDAMLGRLSDIAIAAIHNRQEAK